MRTLFWTLVFLLDGEAGSPSVLGVLAAFALIVAVVGLLAVLDAGGWR